MNNLFSDFLAREERARAITRAAECFERAEASAALARESAARVKAALDEMRATFEEGARHAEALRAVFDRKPSEPAPAASDKQERDDVSDDDEETVFD